MALVGLASMGLRGTPGEVEGKEDTSQLEVGGEEGRKESDNSTNQA